MSQQAVVTGLIATLPFGGVAWDYGQYALGLERLGFEVTYLEDTGFPMFDPSDPEYEEDPHYGVKFVEESLAAMSPTLAGRWHVRAPDGRGFGLAADELVATVADADIFLNVSGACQLREAYMPSRRKVLIDTDPGWNHFVNFPRSIAADGRGGVRDITHHDAYFTYAESLGSRECSLPTLGLSWQPTRPPVVLDSWTPQDPGDTWTTVMSWANYTEPVVSPDGIAYGSKDWELPMIELLPSAVSTPLEMAMGGVNPPFDRWRQLGWRVVDAPSISKTALDYRRYIQQSRGELSVTKNVYVATRSGWFSCRSACYLAASRPVVLQDTGFSAHVPVGNGLLAFDTAEEAARAVADVEADYAAHAEAARHVAAESFAAERVLADLLDQAGLT